MAAIRNATRVLGAGLLALSAVAVFAVAPASASKGLITASVTKEVSGPTGTIATATARCPRRTRVISGGYDPTNVFHPGGSATELVVNTSRRTGRRAWRVSAYQLGGGDTVQLTATANCSADLGRLMARTRHISIDARPGNPAAENASAHCPRHYFALSGGFQLSINGRSTSPSNSPPVSMIIGSRAVARSWAVTGARMGTGHSSMTAFAYCYPTRPLGKSRVGTMHATDPIRNDRLLTPRCPSGWFAASGGFSARFPMGPGQGNLLPVSSGLAGKRRWSFTGISQGGNSPFNGFTYCLRSAR
jgi:hypothetical protein